MLTPKSPEPTFFAEHKLDFSNYSESQQKNYIQNNVRQAAFFYQMGEPVRLYADQVKFLAFGQIHQNWAIIRQNELLLRQGERAEQQNERIIQLLESLATAQSATTTKTCPSCNTAVGDMSFCSQCGHKLAS